jgi:hypothetical protein
MVMGMSLLYTGKIWRGTSPGVEEYGIWGTNKIAKSPVDSSYILKESNGDLIPSI